MKNKVLKLTSKESLFPKLLTEIPDPPKRLYWIGAQPDKILDNVLISVIGSRKASPYGKLVTEKLVGALAKQGIVIVSGLALGVDSLAHRAALNANGLTIAVMPCGLDRIYPSSHHALAREVLAKGGALISEYPIGTDARREHFIARNRLVSGISRGVLIIEAGEKSGTLHTAGFALDQGKEVMAVPGNITSQTSVGTNNLIKAGAHPVTSAQDILNVLNLEIKKPKNLELFGESEQETIVLKLIAQGVSESDEILAKSYLDQAVLNQTLTMLEINGKISSLGSNQWTIL